MAYKRFLFFITLFILAPQATSALPKLHCLDAVKNFEGFKCDSKKTVFASEEDLFYRISGADKVPLLLKVSDINHMSTSSAKMIEKNALLACSHPNVIKFVDQKILSKDKIKLMITEMPQTGLLSDLIDQNFNKRDSIFKNAETTLRIFKGLLEGVAHIHSQGLVHADLKPSKIFLGENYQPLIGGMDFSVRYGAVTNGRGTPNYLDYNFIKTGGEYTYDDTIDIYALGIILYEMTHDGSNPFAHFMVKNIEGRLNIHSFKISHGTDVMAAYLMALCLLENKTLRMPIPDMIQKLDEYLNAADFKSVPITVVDCTQKMEFSDFELVGEKKHQPASQMGGLKVQGNALGLPIFDEGYIDALLKNTKSDQKNQRRVLGKTEQLGGSDPWAIFSVWAVLALASVMISLPIVFFLVKRIATAGSKTVEPLHDVTPAHAPQQQNGLIVSA